MAAATSKFSWKVLGKHPELIPLCGFMALAGVLATAYSIFALATKPDVRINKRSENPPWERVKPTECRKMYTFRDYKSISNPELDRLRKEIGSYKC